MAEAVLDASALLAAILKEPIGGLEELLDRSVMSAVNLTEVRTKLIDLQLLDIRSIEEDLHRLVRIEPFTEEQAVIAADLRRSTRSLGLSLGDRACLALGISLGCVSTPQTGPGSDSTSAAKSLRSGKVALLPL